MISNFLRKRISMSTHTSPPGKPAGSTLVVRVSTALRQKILDGTYRPGDKLPSEARLTAEHGVSRTVVREAVAALRADGLVNPRRGAGVFVLSPPSAVTPPFQNIDRARLSSILELLELRSAVETEAAALAALRRSPAQEEDIFKRHAAVQACIAQGQPTAAEDFELHRAIARATNNPRFLEFLDLLGLGAIPRTALQTSSKDQTPQAYQAHLHAEHQRIVSAISNGDPEAARAAMRAHLQGSQQRYRALLQNATLNL